MAENFGCSHWFSAARPRLLSGGPIKMRVVVQTAVCRVVGGAVLGEFSCERVVGEGVLGELGVAGRADPGLEAEAGSGPVLHSARRLGRSWRARPRKLFSVSFFPSPPT